MICLESDGCKVVLPVLRDALLGFYPTDFDRPVYDLLKILLETQLVRMPNRFIGKHEGSLQDCLVPPLSPTFTLGESMTRSSWSACPFLFTADI